MPATLDRPLSFRTRHGRFTVRHASMLPAVLRCVRTLDAVVERRGFCPTGEGGGVDNSCGSGEGGGAATPQVKAWAEKKFAEPEHAKAFAEWFGDSKTVDDKGEPLVLYHGTGANFDEFKVDTENSWSTALGFDTYFHSENVATASTYANQSKDGQIMENYVSMKNPLEIDAGGGEWFDAASTAQDTIRTYRTDKEREYLEYQQSFNEKYPNSESDPDSVPDSAWSALQKQSTKIQQHILDNPKLYAGAKQQPFGYDGIIVKNVLDNTAAPVSEDIPASSPFTTVYVVFKPTQIKSATGNRGTFDPKNPKITRSSRAWCPGASPPDNSCSPKNKGSGKSGDKGGGVKKAKKTPKKTGDKPKVGRKKGFDPAKSSDAIVKKLVAVDAKLQKKVESEAKKLEKATAETKKALEKITSLDSSYVKAKDESEKNPTDKAKQRALAKIDKQMEAAAVAHQAKVAAYASAKEKLNAIREQRSKAGREVLQQEVSREILEIAGADGLATTYESSKATIQKTHGDRLKKVRDPEARARVADAYTFMLEHTNPAIHAGALQPKLSMRGNVRAYARRGGFDAETFEPTGVPEVVVSSRESPSVIAHEIGHCVEYNPEATRLAQEFRTRRTAGSQEVSFRSKFGRGYKSDERGAPDDFKKAHLAAGYDDKEAEHRAHYTGKRYTSGSTEVISMGVELLKKDPAAFAKADPEWFAFTTGIMTGRLLNESRQKKKARV